MKLTNYMDKEHEYGIFDCIILVTDFYKAEYNITIDVPIYPKTDAWMIKVPKGQIDVCLKKHFIKIDLQNAKNYDLLVFSRKEKIIHFGIFLSPFKMLHIVKGSRAKIEDINDYWRSNIYNVYRVVQ